jgi:hypothetical protein
MAQKFITKEIEEAIRKTPYGSTDGVDRDAKKVIARYFNPCGAGTWYVLEDDCFDDENQIVFGAATLGYGLELGSISLKELQDLRLPFGLRIERDIRVKPFRETLGELRRIYGEEWD